MTNLYSIYISPGAVAPDSVDRLATRYFDEFTRLTAVGAWHGQLEPTLVYQLYRASDTTPWSVTAFAEAARQLCNQQAVLVTSTPADTILITGEPL